MSWVQDDLVKLCEEHPTVVLGDRTTVALQGARQALRGWDRHANLGSTGAHLFRAFMLRRSPDWLSVPFDPADAVHTPRTLAASNPATLQALGEAVRVLQANGLPLEAPLFSDKQWVDLPFAEREIRQDPDLRHYIVRSQPGPLQHR